MRTPYQKWRQSARSVSTSLQTLAPPPSLGVAAHTHMDGKITVCLPLPLPLPLSCWRGVRQSQVACQLAINMKPCPINTNTFSGHRRHCSRPYQLIDAERKVWVDFSWLGNLMVSYASWTLHLLRTCLDIALWSVKVENLLIEALQWRHDVKFPLPKWPKCIEPSWENFN